MMFRKCPTCNQDLQLQSPVEINQLVICENCGQEMEVIWVFPLELAKIRSQSQEAFPQDRNEERKQGAR